MVYLITFYSVFIIAFLVFSVAGIYHLNRYGYAGDLSKPMIVLYSIVSLSIIAVSFVLIINYWPAS